MQLREALDQSHHGHPIIVTHVHTGRPGRPRTEIDPMWLAFVYEHRSTSGIARFLHVGRRTVRRRLLEHDIANPQITPFTVPDRLTSLLSAAQALPAIPEDHTAMDASPQVAPQPDKHALGPVDPPNSPQIEHMAPSISSYM